LAWGLQLWQGNPGWSGLLGSNRVTIRAMVKGGKRRLLGWALFGVLVLMIGGMALAYSVYAKLDTALQELQVANGVEQRKKQELLTMVQGLTQATEEARRRESELVQKHRGSDAENSQLELKASKLETEVKRWQIAYTTEQEKTRKLSQTAQDLLTVMEQAQSRLKGIEEGYKATKQEKADLEEKAKNLEIALKRWQAAHAAAEAKSRFLNQKVEQLSAALKESQEHAYALEQAEKGRIMQLDKEREWKEMEENWGEGYRKALERTFF